MLPADVVKASMASAMEASRRALRNAPVRCTHPQHVPCTHRFPPPPPGTTVALPMGGTGVLRTVSTRMAPDGRYYVTTDRGTCLMAADRIGEVTGPW